MPVDQAFCLVYACTKSEQGDLTPAQALSLVAARNPRAVIEALHTDSKPRAA